MYVCMYVSSLSLCLSLCLSLYSIYLYMYTSLSVSLSLSLCLSLSLVYIIPEWSFKSEINEKETLDTCRAPAEYTVMGTTSLFVFEGIYSTE